MHGLPNLKIYSFITSNNTIGAGQYIEYREQAMGWTKTQRQDNFSSLKHPDLLWAHRVSIKWVRRPLSQGVKWSGCEKDLTLPSSAKITNQCTPLPCHIFMARTGVTPALPTYLLTPWSRVLLEKLTCKLCS